MDGQNYGGPHVQNATKKITEQNSKSQNTMALTNTVRNALKQSGSEVGGVY